MSKACVIEWTKIDSPGWRHFGNQPSVKDAKEYCEWAAARYGEYGYRFRWRKL